MNPPPPLPFVLIASKAPARGMADIALAVGLTVLATMMWLLVFGPVAAAACFVVLVAVFLASWVLGARRRLVVTPAGIEHRGLSGRTTRIPFSGVESVAFFELFAETPRGYRPRVIIIRREGNPIHLDSQYLLPDGPHPLLGALTSAGVRVDHYPAPINLSTLVRTFPRSTSAVVRNRWVVALAAVVTTLVVSVPIAIALVLTVT